MPLIDSDLWKSSFVNLNQLRFHPRNPRIPMLREGASEREIIAALVKQENITVIAKSIVEKGYLRQDRLIVLKENSKAYVYEGNRRLCALKLLDNPDLAPTTAARNAYKKLADKAQLPEKIAVEIVPNKYHAEVVMYSKHAGAEFSRNWKPLQQAMFITEMLEGGDTLEDVSNAVHLKTDQVLGARAAIDLYRFALKANLDGKAREMVEDPSTFPYSIIYERLIAPKRVRQEMGVQITKEGLVVNGTQEGFCAMLATLLNRVAADDLTTRDVNTVDEAVDYIRKLKYKPGIGRVTAKDLDTDPSSIEEDEEENEKEGNRKGGGRSVGTTNKILPMSLTLQYQHEKLSRLIKEGKALKIKGAEHACALLLRTLLEVALTVQAGKRKIYIEPSNPKHGASLNDMLNYVNKNPAQFGVLPQVKGALEALISRAVKQSKPQLDRIAHSPDVVTNVDEVISIREQALPLLTLLLQEPK